MVAAHPEAVRAALAGPLGRHCETVGNTDVAAGCSAHPHAGALPFTRSGGVKQWTGTGSSVEILFVDGVTLRLHCALDRDFGLSLVAATGSAEHVGAVVSRLMERGFSLGASGLEKDGSPVPTPDEETVYAHAGLSYVDPALREGFGEVEAAARGGLPTLISDSDIRGVLHCHTVYSDGKATVAQMAGGAAARGWAY